MHAADLLSKRAYLTPEREALTELDTGRRYTYAELDARANRLANWMRDLGVEKGDRVSILAHNSMAYIDLFYGLAKIGAIFAPLNWRLVARELAYIINNCQPKVLLCGPEFTDVLAEMRDATETRFFPKNLVSLEGAEIAEAYEVFPGPLRKGERGTGKREGGKGNTENGQGDREEDVFSSAAARPARCH